MQFLPVTLNITDKKILLIGGGNVAWQKIKILSQFTDNLTILSIHFNDEINNTTYTKIQKSYSKEDLESFDIIYACTNIRTLNEEIKKDASALHLLVNVVDNPDLCDFISPAIYKKGIFTVSVASNGLKAAKSADIRNKLRDILDNDKTGII